MHEVPAPQTEEPRGGVFTRLKGSTLGNILVLGLTAIAVLAVLWFSDLWRSGSDSDASEGPSGSVSGVEVPESGAPAPEVGMPAPEFTAATLDGGTISLGEAGRPVWLVFSATWCANCRAEIPDVEAMHREYGDAVEIISIYLSDTPSAALNFSTTLGLTHAQIVDPNSEIGALYRVMGVPSHYFIDANGVLQGIEVGVLSPAAMQAHIEKLRG